MAGNFENTSYLYPQCLLTLVFLKISDVCYHLQGNPVSSLVSEWFRSVAQLWQRQPHSVLESKYWVTRGRSKSNVVFFYRKKPVNIGIRTLCSNLCRYQC